jgi:hypothetical protein
MDRLTRKEEVRLRRTADRVRMYVAWLTFIAPVLCGLVARNKYRVQAHGDGLPEIEPFATLGNITGIYLPMWAVVGAYVWATRAAPRRNLAPNGFAMALFRDRFTVVVLTVALGIPIALYQWGGTILEVNPWVVWYQTVLNSLAGGAFVYYFHGRISTEKPEESGAAAPDGKPKRKAPRRRSSQAAESGPAAPPESAAAEESVPAAPQR